MEGVDETKKDIEKLESSLEFADKGKINIIFFGVNIEPQQAGQLA